MNVGLKFVHPENTNARELVKSGRFLLQVTFHRSPIQVTFHRSPIQVTFHRLPIQVTFHRSPIQVTFHRLPIQVIFHRSPIQVTFHRSPIQVTVLPINKEAKQYLLALNQAKMSPSMPGDTVQCVYMSATQ